MGDYDVQYVTVHGHQRAYVKAGTGPALLLLHGMACDHTTWDAVIPQLAQHYTVIAPDLLGHGLSDKPRADYSVGGYANGMRDLLTILGVDKVTVVGHSLGGGVAMQFAYQYPERTERMILVSTGGLGREVTPLIRAVTLPFFQPVMGLLTLPMIRPLLTRPLRQLSRSARPELHDLAEIADIVEALQDPMARRALQHVVRACVDSRGQIISMSDRAYLTAAMPMCVIWGARDPVIPTRHAEHVRRIAETARVEIVQQSGHFPHKDHPDQFVKIVRSFVDSSQPATYHRGRWRALLKNGAPAGLVVPDSRVVTIA